MKPLLILMRIVFVGLFWSIFFLEGIRTIMLINWHFDILRASHWEFAWRFWNDGKWVIKAPKEWAFVLIILTFIPVWLTGWTALSMVKWGKIFRGVLALPLKILNKILENPVKKIANTASVRVVKKKKSYKEVRPRSIRPPMEQNSYALPARKGAAPGAPTASSLSKPVPTAASTFGTPAKSTAPVEFDHSLFKLDEEPADFDFDLFDDKPKTETPPPAPVAAPSTPVSKNHKNGASEPSVKNNKNKTSADKSVSSAPSGAPTRSSSNSTLDVLKQKGYEVITGATIKNTLIDFIGVASGQICLCLNDKEPGDWLADEERFNDEEPLWFSESSHRISPVRKIDIARLILKDKLAEADFNFEIEAYVIEQIGNIINAEDMFEIWNEMKINVTRIDRGTPKELRLFAKALDDAATPIEPDKFEKIKKMIRSIS